IGLTEAPIMRDYEGGSIAICFYQYCGYCGRVGPDVPVEKSELHLPIFWISMSWTSRMTSSVVPPALKLWPATSSAGIYKLSYVGLMVNGRVK
ncbi:24261_t:CDS:2, partial [Gigaspora margarita]